jgi:outer membrane protein assembly factor BamB
MYAIDAITGAERWRADLGSGIYASAVVTENRVYANGLSGTLHALDAETGTILWIFEMGNPAYSSPSLSGNVLYTLSELGGLLYGLDAETGEELWRYQTGRQGDFRSSSPVIVDGVLYIGSNSEGLLALEAAD